MDENAIRQTLDSERDRLEKMRADLLESDDLGPDSENEPEDNDDVDYTGLANRTETLAQVQQIESELSEVRAALEKLDNGNYGISELSGDPIAPERLEAVPTARYTAEEQQQIDEGSLLVSQQDN